MVPVRALVYSRVSTDAQERDGLEFYEDRSPSLAELSNLEPAMAVHLA